ncbi:LysM peptidoglycan-binding domain-containing protein [Marivita hallyeonensis]|uniref:Nucleoid-associated protein YgaU, contains BON and LysM domains n=1 Tax=Marivita hallyeonensis TaxID=996342 RepID=A0A1M5S140_9RHOB|nr:LysM peptidoglycan-binding domain-containing protein [Marivita hallyeonensis]SHH32159.1 Nucleoid-associated protein YgaU, contains BON and LysM domains [Marivita hallyeonensis]
MSKFALTKGPSGLVLGGAAAVGAIVLALYVSGSLFPSSEPETSEPVVEAQPAPVTTETVQAEPVAPPETDDAVAAVSPEVAEAPREQTVEATPDTAQDAVSDERIDTADVATPEPPDAPATVAPTFDIVRVAPDGQTLVAGSAPGSRDVQILIDGAEAGRTVVDGSGKFVAFLDLPRSTAPRVVTLLAEGSGGPVEGMDQVILAPSVEVAEAPEPAPVQSDGAIDQVAVATQAEVASGAPQPDQVSTTTEEVGAVEPVVTAEAPAMVVTEETVAAETEQTAEAAVETALAEAPSEPATAPTVILSTEDGVEVLQAAGPTPDVLDRIALDAITYEDAGAVALSGRGAADEFVRVYLDNQPVLTTEIAEDGRWRADLPDVDSGTYTLRVDAVDAEGTVTSRIESPFRREDPVVLALASAAQETQAILRVVTVQPGNTLWAIARDRYGEGPAYVKVFEANRDRIRNPDLIYPGQVFSIPD